MLCAFYASSIFEYLFPEAIVYTWYTYAPVKIHTLSKCQYINTVVNIQSINKELDVWRTMSNALVALQLKREKKNGISSNK